MRVSNPDLQPALLRLSAITSQFFIQFRAIESEVGRPAKNGENATNVAISQTEAAEQMRSDRRSVQRAKAKIKGKPKPEPKDRGTPEEPKDEAGKPVLGPARTYWDRREEAERHLAMLRAAKRTMKALLPDDPMWCEVNLNGVLADLASAINRFTSAVPAYVCPYCKGIRVEGCKSCKGRGCMSKFLYTHAVPEEMKRESK